MCSVGHKSVLPNRNRQMTYMHRGNCRSSVCRSKGGRPVVVGVELNSHLLTGLPECYLQCGRTEKVLIAALLLPPISPPILFCNPVVIINWHLATRFSTRWWAIQSFTNCSMRSRFGLGFYHLGSHTHDAGLFSTFVLTGLHLTCSRRSCILTK